jgi:hypothetical protein
MMTTIFFMLFLPPRSSCSPRLLEFRSRLLRRNRAGLCFTRGVSRCGSSDYQAKFESELKIDVKERLEHSLDDVIEPSIGRQLGLLVSEDDFSAAGAIDYKPPTVHREETNLEEFAQELQKVAEMISAASEERDRTKEIKQSGMDLEHE